MIGLAWTIGDGAAAPSRRSAQQLVEAQGGDVGRKVVRLTLDHLAELEGPSMTCLFWELDPVRRARVKPSEAREEKEAWFSEVLREWGSCGRVVLVDERPVGYVVYVPAALAPGASVLPTAPVSPDAVLMTTAYVAPHARGGGLGRMLVQGMARDLIERGGVRAVEAFGDTRDGQKSAKGDRHQCVLPLGFLSGVGFKTQRAHPTTPRLRMDLRSALTWRDEFELALERLLGVVRPARHPSPETRRTGSLP
jgi:GNAT superfamily N-acetyltransferase